MNLLTAIIVLLVTHHTTSTPINSSSEQIEQIEKSWNDVETKLTKHLELFDSGVRNMTEKLLSNYKSKLEQAVEKSFPSCYNHSMIVYNLINDLENIGSEKNERNYCYMNIDDSLTYSRKQLEWGKRRIKPMIAKKNLCPNNGTHCNGEIKYEKAKLTIQYISWRWSNFKSVEHSISQLETCYNMAIPRVIDNIQKLNFSSEICSVEGWSEIIETVPKRWLTLEKYRNETLFDLESKLYHEQIRLMNSNLTHKKGFETLIGNFLTQSSKVENCLGEKELCDSGNVILTLIPKNTNDQRFNFLELILESPNVTEQIDMLKNLWQWAISRTENIINAIETRLDPTYIVARTILTTISQKKNISRCSQEYSGQMVHELTELILHQKLTECSKNPSLKSLSREHKQIVENIYKIGWKKGDGGDNKGSPIKLLKLMVAFVVGLEKLKGSIIPKTEELAIKECFRTVESPIIDFVTNIEFDMKNCSTNSPNFERFLANIFSFDSINHLLIENAARNQMQQFKKEFDVFLTTIKEDCSQNKLTSKEKRDDTIKCNDIIKIEAIRNEMEPLLYCYQNEYCREAKQLLTHGKIQYD